MKIKRISLLTGRIHEMDVGITQQQLDQFEAIKNKKWLVPHLREHERRFLMFGTSLEEQRLEDEGKL